MPEKRPEGRKDAVLLQDFLEVAPDAFVVAQEDGTVVQLNRQAERLFGYDARELVGASVDTLLPARFRENHRAHRADFHANPRMRTMGEGMDLFGRRKDGSEFPVDISLGPIRTRDGVFVVAAIRDATQRKRAEAMSRQLEDSTQRRRQALELNDSIVQGLAAARMALDLGATKEVEKLLEGTIAAAQGIINDLLSDIEGSGGIQPGDLVRSRPAVIKRD